MIVVKYSKFLNKYKVERVTNNIVDAFWKFTTSENDTLEDIIKALYRLGYESSEIKIEK